MSKFLSIKEIQGPVLSGLNSFQFLTPECEIDFSIVELFSIFDNRKYSYKLIEDLNSEFKVYENNRYRTLDFSWTNIEVDPTEF